MTNENSSPQKSTINPGTLGGLVDVSEIHLNVQQALLITTEDRVRLHLSSHLKNVEKKRSWIAPLGVLLTIIVTLVTARFKEDSPLFSPSTWEAIFVMTGLLSFGWLIYSLWQAWQSESMDDLIERLKRESK